MMLQLTKKLKNTEPTTTENHFIWINWSVNAWYDDNKFKVKKKQQQRLKAPSYFSKKMLKQMWRTPFQA